MKKESEEKPFSCYIYNEAGEKQAWCHNPETAACILCAMSKIGWTAKWRKHILYTWSEITETPRIVAFQIERAFIDANLKVEENKRTNYGRRKDN